MLPEDEPYVLEKSDAMIVLLGEQAVDRALSSFAGQYKRSKDGKETGRAQFPLLARQGKEEIYTFLKRFSEPCVDITSVEGGASFAGSVWFWGSCPANEKVMIPHNCSAVARALVHGELNVVLIDMVSLSKSYLHDKVGFEKLKDYMDGIEAFTGEKVDAIKAAGVRILSHHMVGGQVLNVPMGWLLLEKVPKSASLVYGVRRSYFRTSEHARSGYATCVNLFRQDGRNIERMDNILDLLKPVEEDDGE